MPNTSALPAATWTLIAQQLKDVGITANFTDAGNNFISDVLAPKYAATWLQLQQDPDWQLITFEITPTATFNPFKYTNPDVAALIQAVHDAKIAGRLGRRGEGAERLRRGERLVRALVPGRVQLCDGRQHQRADAGRERLPVPVELHAEVQLISAGSSGQAARPGRPLVP